MLFSRDDRGIVLNDFMSRAGISTSDFLRDHPHTVDRLRAEKLGAKTITIRDVNLPQSTVFTRLSDTPCNCDMTHEINNSPTIVIF